MDIFIKGKVINLVVLNENLARDTNWYNWFNSEKYTRFMQKHYFPNDKENQITFAKNINKSKENLVLGIAYKNQLVGVCGLHDINYINSNCTISIIIGENIQDENVALESFYLIMNHGFSVLNLKKIKMGQHISLKIFTLKLYNVFGFFQEGILKEDLYKNGKYYDVILSSVFREKFYEKTSNSDLIFLKKR